MSYNNNTPPEKNGYYDPSEHVFNSQAAAAAINALISSGTSIDSLPRDAKAWYCLSPSSDISATDKQKYCSSLNVENSEKNGKVNNQPVNIYNPPKTHGRWQQNLIATRSDKCNNKGVNNSNTTEKNEYKNDYTNGYTNDYKNGNNDPSTQPLAILSMLQSRLRSTVIQPMNDILSSISEQPINVPHHRLYGGVPNPFYRPDNQQHCNIMCPRGHTLSTDGSCKCIPNCTKKCPDGKVLTTDGSCKCITDSHGMPSIEQQLTILTSDMNQAIEHIGIGLSSISKHLSYPAGRVDGRAPGFDMRFPRGNLTGRAPRTYRNMVGGSRSSRVKKSKKTLRNCRS